MESPKCQYPECKTPNDKVNTCIICHKHSCNTCYIKHCEGCDMDHSTSKHKCFTCKDFKCCSLFNRCQKCYEIQCDKCLNNKLCSKCQN